MAELAAEALRNPLSERWSFSELDYLDAATTRDQLRFFLRYAILAPSSHNTQPWLFWLLPDAVELYADRTRALAVVDPEDRELIISCGAALYNLRLAFRYFGYQEEVELFPDPECPDLLARVNIAGSHIATVAEQQLFSAIQKRHTNRHAFDGRSLPEAVLARLQAAVPANSISLDLITDETLRHQLAHLIAEGDRLQMSNPHFRRELAAWIHSRRSQDGMPGYAQGMSELLDFATPLITHLLRTFDVGAGQAARDQSLVEGSPVLALLRTANDRPTDWLETGQLLQRVVLQACVDGVSASFFNQPIEVPSLRHRLCETLNVTGYPQILVRLGYGPAGKPTPRRSLSEVVIKE
jgi:hypothetical protein